FQIAPGDARNGRSAGIPYSLMPAWSGGRFATASSSLRKSDASSAVRTRNAPTLAKLMASGLESSMLAIIPAACRMGGGTCPQKLLQLRQIHFGIVSLAFDVLGDGLPADDFAALLVECQCRLSVKLPP